MSLSTFVGHPKYPRRYNARRKSDTDIVPIEMDILLLCAYGYTTKEIAELLKQPETTIETYRVRLIKRLNARNTPNMIAIAISSGILSNLDYAGEK